MKTYYEDEFSTIIHGDCRDVLPNIGRCDLVLTDPPYGIDGGRGGDSRRYRKGAYEGTWRDTTEYIVNVVVPIFFRMRDAGQRMIVTPGIRHLHRYPIPDDMGCFWTPASCTHGPWGLTTFQPILYYGKDPRAGRGPLPSGRQVTERAPAVGHPCPKPMGAWGWLLNKGSTCPVDVILDPFMGSGTTLRAAKDLNRKAIGIEIEEKYCEIAARRLQQEVFDFREETQ